MATGLYGEEVHVGDKWTTVGRTITETDVITFGIALTITGAIFSISVPMPLSAVSIRGKILLAAVTVLSTKLLTSKSKS